MKLTVYNNFKVRNNFTIKEFVCKCGCNTLKIDGELLDLVQAIRYDLGLPVNIVSAYRCANHNRRVGGAKKSQHLYGRAADIDIKDFLYRGYTYQELYDIAVKNGATGVGFYDTFIHVDTRPRKGAPAHWDNRVKNKEMK